MSGIVLDGKDWTWILERTCKECGFDASSAGHDAVSGLVRANAARWAELLRHEHVAVRPAPDRWSALEYACHVRDVFRLYDVRLHLMLDEDDPLFPNWDQDATAVQERYDRQDPARVADELVEAGAQVAASFDAVAEDQWTRTGARSDGACFTIDTFARYFVHDPIHHVHDVEVGYRMLQR